MSQRGLLEMSRLMLQGWISGSVSKSDDVLIGTLCKSTMPRFMRLFLLKQYPPLRPS